MERGFLTIARPWGVPIRLHWSLPLGAFLLGGGQLVPGFWLGIFLLVLVHEVGHAALVRLYRLPLVSIDVHGFGGLCRFRGEPTARQSAVIAWGGVLAQLALFVPVVLLAPIVIPRLPPSGVWLDLQDAWTRANLMMIAFNLLPFHPLDGATAWSLFRHLHWPRRRPRVDEAALDAEVARIFERAQKKAKEERSRDQLH